MDWARDAAIAVNLVIAVVTLLVLAVRIPSRLAVLEWKVDALWKKFGNGVREK